MRDRMGKHWIPVPVAGLFSKLKSWPWSPSPFTCSSPGGNHVSWLGLQGLLAMASCHTPSTIPHLLDGFSSCFAVSCLWWGQVQPHLGRSPLLTAKRPWVGGAWLQLRKSGLAPTYEPWAKWHKSGHWLEVGHSPCEILQCQPIRSHYLEAQQCPSSCAILALVQASFPIL